jgi:hypothetical protein
VSRTEASRAPANAFQLWFGLIAPPAAWFIHLSLAYILVPFTCRIAGRGWLYVISAALAGVTVAAGVVAWRKWRELGDGDKRAMITDMEGDREGFMIYGGVLASALFLFAIVLTTIPILFVNPCVPMEGI